MILLVILSAYAVNPTESNPMHSAIFLSYRREPRYPGEPVMYGKGKKDFAFVAFYTVFLSFTREFLMQRVIRPWAIYCGIRSKAKIARFMEQVYTAMYFAIFGPFGLYVMSRTNIWYFNTTAMFEGFPHREHEADFKAYYLLEAAYWAQQAIVLLLQLEKPRKDFKELVGHHIITLALIFLSYRFHFTYMGLAVYITHDISDFFLAVRFPLSFCENFLTRIDVKNSQLSGFPDHWAVFWTVCCRLDLPATLPEPQDPLGSADGIPNCGTVRAELGDATVQMLDQSDHHLCLAGQLAGGQPLLAVPDPAHSEELPLEQREEGRTERQ